MATRKYVYKGPVYRFENCVIDKWVAITQAPSEEKALNNLQFRAKAELQLTKNAKIRLMKHCLEEV